MDYGVVTSRDPQRQCGVIHPDHGGDIAIGPGDYVSSGFAASAPHARVCFHVTEDADGTRHADHIVAESLLEEHNTHHGQSTFSHMRSNGASLIY